MYVLWGKRRQRQIKRNHRKVYGRREVKLSQVLLRRAIISVILFRNAIGDIKDPIILCDQRQHASDHRPEKEQRGKQGVCGGLDIVLEDQDPNDIESEQKNRRAPKNSFYIDLAFHGFTAFLELIIPYFRLKINYQSAN